MGQSQLSKEKTPPVAEEGNGAWGRRGSGTAHPPPSRSGSSRHRSTALLERFPGGRRPGLEAPGSCRLASNASFGGQCCPGGSRRGEVAAFPKEGEQAWLLLLWLEPTAKQTRESAAPAFTAQDFLSIDEVPCSRRWRHPKGQTRTLRKQTSPRPPGGDRRREESTTSAAERAQA